jgi:hypothetical protein
MNHVPTETDARQSLSDHVASRGAEIRAKYGPTIGWAELKRIVADPDCVRYPTEIVFDAGPLLLDECAFPLPLGEKPEDGFRLCIHPYFSLDPSRVPLLALYQLVVINYGAFASADDAEAFGAAVLGMDKENYYQALCQMADEIGADTHLDSGGSPRECGCEKNQ